MAPAAPIRVPRRGAGCPVDRPHCPGPLHGPTAANSLPTKSNCGPRCFCLPTAPLASQRGLATASLSYLWLSFDVLLLCVDHSLTCLRLILQRALSLSLSLIPLASLSFSFEQFWIIERLAKFVLGGALDMARQLSDDVRVFLSSATGLSENN